MPVSNLSIVCHLDVCNAPSEELSIEFFDCGTQFLSNHFKEKGTILSNLSAFGPMRVRINCETKTFPLASQTIGSALGNW